MWNTAPRSTTETRVLVVLHIFLLPVMCVLYLDVLTNHFSFLFPHYHCHFIYKLVQVNSTVWSLGNRIPSKSVHILPKEVLREEILSLSLFLSQLLCLSPGSSLTPYTCCRVYQCSLLKLLECFSLLIGFWMIQKVYECLKEGLEKKYINLPWCKKNMYQKIETAQTK